MNDRQRISQWFEDGRIVRPRAGNRADIVDLIKAIATRSGARGIEVTPKAQRVCTAIGAHEHIVFVLIDGLGLHLLRDLSAGSASEAGGANGFLMQHTALELEAVFPSTTAVALTSLGTGAYPTSHGILGWWTWLARNNVIAEVLPFVERFSKKPLADFGVRSEDVFVAPSLLPKLNQPLVVTRSYICNSVYSRYWSGGTPSAGYERISEGVDIVLQRVAAAEAPSYTHLYLPQLDESCHHHGIDHENVAKVFSVLQTEMERLHAGLKGKARLIISADHGHVNRMTDRHIHVDDPIMQLLKCPPVGEPTAPLFHVKEGQLAAFREMFTATFGDMFSLLTIDEVEEMQMLGPEKLSPATRQHFGDFMAIAPQPNTIHFINPPYKTVIHRGVHAGLTPGEMLVPLILA
jgi:hypothetical protein